MPLLKPALATLVAASLFAAARPGTAPEATEPAGTAIPAPAVLVGDRLIPEQVHVLAEPGRYGLGPQIRGSRYGIAEGHLIRFDPDSLQVQSVLRRQHQLPD